jgi:glycosyltransferase involved in cell wall biosynthesis
MIEMQINIDLKSVEWVIIDDSETPVTNKIFDLTNKLRKLTYIKLPHRVFVGVKRNIAKEVADGDILIHMDDDDYYNRHYLSNMCASLQDPAYKVAGSSGIYFIYPNDPFLYLSGPFHKNHTCAGIMAYRKDYARENNFGTLENKAEERMFLQSYRTPIRQIADSFKIYLPLAHYSNTVDKTNVARKKTDIHWFNFVSSCEHMNFYLSLYPLHLPLMLTNETGDKSSHRLIGASGLKLIVSTFSLFALRTFELIGEV